MTLELFQYAPNFGGIRVILRFQLAISIELMD